MNNHTPHVMDDVLTWAKTFTVDLPLTSIQWAFGTGEEEAVAKSAWRGYDAGVRVLTSMIDTLYRLPLSRVTLDRTASTLLRWQSVSNAISTTMIAGLWHTVGVPTTTEMHTLEASVDQLVTEIREQRDVQQILQQLVMQLAQAKQTTEHTGIPRSGVNGSNVDQPRLQHTVTRPAHLKGH